MKFKLGQTFKKNNNEAAMWAIEHGYIVIFDEESNLYKIAVNKNFKKPGVEQISSVICLSVQNHIDSVMSERGYDSVISCISYINSSVERFKNDATVAKDWRDKVWVTCYKNIEKYKSGEIDILTSEDVINSLPKIKWID